MASATEKSIPHDLHECGYAGIAQAATFMACSDIAKHVKKRLDDGKDPRDIRSNSDCMSAIYFLRRKKNTLYTLDIPGEELIETIFRRSEDEWKRKHRADVPCRNGRGRKPHAHGQS